MIVLEMFIFSSQDERKTYGDGSHIAPVGHSLFERQGLFIPPFENDVFDSLVLTSGVIREDIHE